MRSVIPPMTRRKRSSYGCCGGRAWRGSLECRTLVKTGLFVLCWPPPVRRWWHTWIVKGCPIVRIQAMRSRSIIAIGSGWKSFLSSLGWRRLLSVCCSDRRTCYARTNNTWSKLPINWCRHSSPMIPEACNALIAKASSCCRFRFSGVSFGRSCGPTRKWGVPAAFA